MNICPPAATGPAFSPAGEKVSAERTDEGGAAHSAPLTSRLKAFARWAIQEGPWNGCDLDGADVQDKAVSLGLLRVEPFDPEKFASDPETVGDWPDAGEDWYVFTADLTMEADPREALLIAALCHADAVSVLLNDIHAALVEATEGRSHEARWDPLYDLLRRRLDDCSAAPLFLEAKRCGVVLTSSSDNRGLHAEI